MKIFPFFILIILLAGCNEEKLTPSYPKDNLLLEFTQDWGRNSELGILPEKKLEEDEIELRYWSGYGVLGTKAVILKHESNSWKSYLVEILPCEVLSTKLGIDSSIVKHFEIPIRYTKEIECSSYENFDLEPDVLHITDSVSVTKLPYNSELGILWKKLKQLDITRLPPEDKPLPHMSTDGHTYVVELKIGETYRATVTHNIRLPDSDLDRRVHKMAEIIDSYLNTSIYDTF